MDSLNIEDKEYIHTRPEVSAKWGSVVTHDGNLDEELTLKLDTSTQREGLTILRQMG